MGRASSPSGGCSLALAEEVAQFGIKITLVEPGFFRTDLLAPSNVRWASQPVDDYLAEGSPEAMWSPYDGAQTGDPAKLGEALVELRQQGRAAKGVRCGQRRDVSREAGA